MSETDDILNEFSLLKNSGNKGRYCLLYSFQALSKSRTRFSPSTHQTITDHLEEHIGGLTQPCSDCGTKMENSKALREHKAKMHGLPENWRH